jgi:hypothetical protein
MDDFQALVDDAVAWRKWSALHPIIKAKMLRDEAKELASNHDEVARAVNDEG